MNAIKEATSFTYLKTGYYFNEEENELKLHYEDECKVEDFKYSTYRVGEQIAYFEVENNKFYEYFYDSSDEEPVLVKSERLYLYKDNVIDEFTFYCFFFVEYGFYFDESLYSKEGNVYTLKKDEATAEKMIEYADYLLKEDLMAGNFVIEITIENGLITIYEKFLNEGAVYSQTVYFIKDINKTTVNIPEVD